MVLEIDHSSVPTAARNYAVMVLHACTPVALATEHLNSFHSSLGAGMPQWTVQATMSGPSGSVLVNELDSISGEFHGLRRNLWQTLL